MRTTLPSGTPAELVVPSGGPSRGLVIVPDIMGLRPLFDDLCSNLASQHGWAVCAVEPFPGGEDVAHVTGMSTLPLNSMYGPTFGVKEQKCVRSR